MGQGTEYKGAFRPSLYCVAMKLSNGITKGAVPGKLDCRPFMSGLLGAHFVRAPICATPHTYASPSLLVRYWIRADLPPMYQGFPQSGNPSAIHTCPACFTRGWQNTTPLTTAPVCVRSSIPTSGKRSAHPTTQIRVSSFEKGVSSADALCHRLDEDEKGTRSVRTIERVLSELTVRVLHQRGSALTTPFNYRLLESMDRRPTNSIIISDDVPRGAPLVRNVAEKHVARGDIAQPRGGDAICTP